MRAAGRPRGGALRCALALVPAFMAAPVVPISAQPRPLPTAEVRLDALVGPAAGVQAGAGGQVPLGYYVRAGAAAAAGLERGAGGTAASWRAEAIARFLLDPIRQTRYGLSLGGGLNVQGGGVAGGCCRAYLTAVLDLELPRRGQLVPAVQAAVGGGTRIGLLVRRARGSWR